MSRSVIQSARRIALPHFRRLERAGITVPLSAYHFRPCAQFYFGLTDFQADMVVTTRALHSKGGVSLGAADYVLRYFNFPLLASLPVPGRVAQFVSAPGICPRVAEDEPR